MAVGSDTAVPPGIEPHAQLRRSFVYRKLLDLGARFGPINGGPAVSDPTAMAYISCRLFSGS